MTELKDLSSMVRKRRNLQRSQTKLEIVQSTQECTSFKILKRASMKTTKRESSQLNRQPTCKPMTRKATKKPMMWTQIVKHIAYPPECVWRRRMQLKERKENWPKN